MNWRRLTKRRRVILLSAIAAVMLLILYGWVGSRQGIWYEDCFLYRQASQTWQGMVCGEELTIQREQGALLLTTPSGRREFRVEGQAGYGQTMTLWEDGVQVFTGSYVGGHLLLADGAVFDGGYVTSQTYVDGKPVTKIKENGVFRPRTALDMEWETAVGMIFQVDERPRVNAAVPWLAALFLLFAFAELWWPDLWFHWNVGRFVDREVSPSEDYRNIRTVGIVSLFLIAGLTLALGYAV